MYPKPPQNVVGSLGWAQLASPMCLWSAGVLAGASWGPAGKTRASPYMVSHFLADQKMWWQWWDGIKENQIPCVRDFFVVFLLLFFAFCFFANVPLVN